jgi:hypothetical protein
MLRFKGLTDGAGTGQEDTRAVAILVVRCLHFMGVDAKNLSAHVRACWIWGRLWANPPRLIRISSLHPPHGVEGRGAHKVMLMRSQSFAEGPGVLSLSYHLQVYDTFMSVLCIYFSLASDSSQIPFVI